MRKILRFILGLLLLDGCTFEGPAVTGSGDEPSFPGEVGKPGAFAPGHDDVALPEPDPDPPKPPDGDLDGIPDEMDDCPMVANAHQSDVDGDGLGDACDTNCDVSLPASPLVFGPESSLRVDSPDLDGGGITATVDPGASVALSFYWRADQTSSCPDCITQLYYGYGDPNLMMGCAFDAVPDWYSVSDGWTDATATAPMTPGVYRFRADWSWDWNCNASNYSDAHLAFAAICVVDRS